MTGEHAAGGAPAGTVFLAEIARWAGMGRAAVANWRRVYPDFPAPAGGSATSPVFTAEAVGDWLRAHGHPGCAWPEEPALIAQALVAPLLHAARSGADIEDALEQWGVPAAALAQADRWRCGASWAEGEPVAAALLDLAAGAVLLSTDGDRAEAVAQLSRRIAWLESEPIGAHHHAERYVVSAVLELVAGGNRQGAVDGLAQWLSVSPRCTAGVLLLWTGWETARRLLRAERHDRAGAAALPGAHLLITT